MKAPVRHLHRLKGRWYWIPSASAKKLGFRSAPLGADLHKATQQAEELNKQLDGERDKAPSKPRARSVADLIKEYRASPQFEDRAPKTRKDYGAILDRISAKYGQVMVASIEREDVVKTYAKLRKATGEAMAAAIMRVWRILFGFAYDSGWRKDNPAKGLRLKTIKPRDIVWTDPQILAFCRAAEAAGRASLSLAMLIAYDLGQRPGDVLKLTWEKWDGSGFFLKQGKTETRISVPVLPALAEKLNEMRADFGPVMICESTGVEWKEDHSRHEFARIRKLAGLPSTLQFRDMRRTALTDAGNAGATEDELRAISGHKDRNVISTYVVPSREMAASAQTKRLAKKATESKPDEDPV